MQYIQQLLIVSFLSFSLTACSKTWLEAKPDKSAVIPQTLEELQALLDNDSYMNRDLPFLGELSTDDYYVADNTWTTETALFTKNLYVWAEDVYQGNKAISILNDCWNKPYRMAFYANIALDGLQKIPVNDRNAARYNTVKGNALFFRSFAFYHLLQQFAPAYDDQRSQTEAGVPLRLNAGIDEPSIRATVAAGYQQILADLQEAATFLQADAGIQTRPSKAAAFALLARTYLQMAVYDKALQYADSALHYQATLLDYNSTAVKLTAAFPFTRFNGETIFYSTMASAGFTTYPQRKIDTVLYDLYEANDLRRQAFFSPQADGIKYIGSYDGTATFFYGLATDEVYLIKAESEARLQKTAEAMATLNALLTTRWETDTYVPLTAATAQEGLAYVLTERRKELVHRGLRWSDLKRLNKEAFFAKTLKRIIAGQTYLLPPNDPRYVLPIPDIAIELSGIAQNDRK